MRLLSKKTRLKLMAQALVITTVFSIGVGCNLMLTEPIQAEATLPIYSGTTVEINNISYTYNGINAIVTDSTAVGNVTIPSTITVNGMTYSVVGIGIYAFGNHTGITSVTIPSSVTFIHNAAFNGCSGMTSISIPNSVVTILSSCFAGCSSLTSVTIPSSVKCLDSYTFADCTSLMSVQINNANQDISDTAFLNCSKVTTYKLGGITYTLNQMEKTATVPYGTIGYKTSFVFNQSNYTVIMLPANA